MSTSNEEIILKIGNINNKLFDYQLNCEKLNKILKVEDFKENKKFHVEKIIYITLISVIIILNLICVYLIINKK